MSRLPRLVVPHRAHYVVQRGHSGQPVFADDTDRQAFLAALREASAAQRVTLHAYALLDSEVHLLATPSDAVSLGRMVQTLGRRYVSAYNRRHGRSGTLWDGRFRCAVVEPGSWQLAALRLIDGLPGLTSAVHRTGEPRDTMLADPPEFWQLGNTPFEREAAYRTLLVQGLAPAQAAALRGAALGGWAVGSASFIAQLAAQTARPVRPRPRGRPAAG
jgi:putative transposase